MKSILENAVQSIQVGVEDYKSDDSRRILSALRNIYAGILLLYKEKLLSLSPKNSKEALIKAKIKPELIDNKIEYVGSGKKTVNVHQIQERFSSLKIKTDWKTLEKLNNIRNNIEHYYSTEPESRIREAITYSLILIRDFSINHLDFEPVELLGEKTWNILLEVSEIYKKEETDCKFEMEKVQWGNESLRKACDEIFCPKCSSGLIKPINPKEDYIQDLKMFCSSCGKNFYLYAVIDEVVYEYFYPEFYLSMTDGNDAPLEDCPDCLKGTYIIAEGICAFCGYRKKYTECAVCHCSLSIDEQEFNGVCSYHHNLWMKDD